MKAGIITFHASLNCGSMLQAYALQEVLIRKFEINTEIINYSNRGQRQYYALWDTKLRPRIIKSNLKALPYYKYIKKVNADYRDFFYKYFNLSGPMLKKMSDLNNIEENYDIIIAGGDQVWNIRCRDADDAYFLSFVNNKKKVSYAPSLGGIDINKYAKNPLKYTDLLKSFDYLSVRENNGQKWLKKLTGKNVPVIADPALLLTAKEWCDYLPVSEINERFIFYYAFSYSNIDNNKAMQEINHKTGLPVYMIDARSWAICRLDRYGIKLYKKAGPLGFLSLIKAAELIITESFHGTLFSALFKKNFWSCRNRIAIDPDDDRAMCILAQLGLIDRYKILDELPDIDIFKEIDYKPVHKRIKEIREVSLEYIRGFINERD